MKLFLSFLLMTALSPSVFALAYQCIGSDKNPYGTIMVVTADVTDCTLTINSHKNPSVKESDYSFEIVRRCPGETPQTIDQAWGVWRGLNEIYWTFEDAWRPYYLGYVAQSSETGTIYAILEYTGSYNVPVQEYYQCRNISNH